MTRSERALQQAIELEAERDRMRYDARCGRVHWRDRRLHELDCTRLTTMANRLRDRAAKLAG